MSRGPTGLPDHMRMADYLAAMEKARENTAAQAPGDEEAAKNEFREWLDEAGWTGATTREIDDEGKVVWAFLIHTGRGTVRAHARDVNDWRAALEEIGLA